MKKILTIVVISFYCVFVKSQLLVQPSGQVDIQSKLAVIGNINADMLDVKNESPNIVGGADLIWGYYSLSQPNNPGLLSLNSYDGCQFTIRNNGRVGIGTMNPQFALDVTSTIRVGALTYPSDVRLKTNIVGLGKKTDLLYAIRGLSYNYKNEIESGKQKVMDNVDGKPISKNSDQQLDGVITDRSHIGFIAQEVKSIYPELVYEDESGLMSIDYIGFIPILIEALKE